MNERVKKGVRESLYVGVRDRKNHVCMEKRESERKDRKKSRESISV